MTSFVLDKIKIAQEQIQDLLDKVRWAAQCHSTVGNDTMETTLRGYQLDLEQILQGLDEEGE